MSDNSLVNVQIDAEAVNRYVADAVLNSALGKELQKKLTELLQDRGSVMRDDAITTAIKRVITDEIVRLLHNDEKIVGLIRQRIESQIVEKMTDEMVGKMIDKLLR